MPNSSRDADIEYLGVMVNMLVKRQEATEEAIISLHARKRWRRRLIDLSHFVHVTSEAQAEVIQWWADLPKSQRDITTPLSKYNFERK